MTEQAPAVVEPTPAPTPAPEPEAKAVPAEPEWLPERLERAKKSAVKSLLESVGVQSPDDIAAALEKAKKLDQIEAEQMTELEKTAKERDDLAQRLADLESRDQAAQALKAKEQAALAAAKELGYPSADKALSLAKYLEGDDLGEAAKTLFADFKPDATPVPAAVHDVTAEPKEDPVRKAFLGLK